MVGAAHHHGGEEREQRHPNHNFAGEPGVLEADGQLALGTVRPHIDAEQGEQQADIQWVQ
ncbi:hypothetical protein D3C81_2252000 [compost metagenome]